MRSLRKLGPFFPCLLRPPFHFLWPLLAELDLNIGLDDDISIGDDAEPVTVLPVLPSPLPDPTPFLQLSVPPVTTPVPSPNLKAKAQKVNSSRGEVKWTQKLDYVLAQFGTFLDVVLALALALAAFSSLPDYLFFLKSP